LLDNLITEAILRTYKRAAIRPSNPIPTFSDLQDELFLHVQGTALARLPAFSRSAALPRRSPADALVSPASSSPASTTTESCRRILRNAERAARSAAGSSRCSPAAPRSQLLRSHPSASSGWCHSANCRCPGPPDRVSHTLSGATAVKPMVSEAWQLQGRLSQLVRVNPRFASRCTQSFSTQFCRFTDLVCNLVAVLCLLIFATPINHNQE
jgi:hypothetical protein